LQELEKLGKVRKPRNGKLATLLISFLHDGRICRKLTPLIITKTAKKDAELHMRALCGSQFQPFYRNIKHRKKRTEWASFQRGKLCKVELRNFEPSTLQLAADRLEQEFLGTKCFLLGLRAEFGDTVKKWSNSELIENENYVGLVRSRASVEHARNNGGKGIHFYERFEHLYKVELAIKLDLPLERVDSVLESISNELKNFNA